MLFEEFWAIVIYLITLFGRKYMNKLPTSQL